MPKLFSSRQSLVVSILIHIAFLLLSTIYYLPSTIYARVTPQDRIDELRQRLEERVKNYSNTNKENLLNISSQIEKMNKEKAEELERNMALQGAILDEYERRLGKESERVKNARYWITFAHEAVAYQAGKVYIFELSGESNLKSDILRTVNKFESELNYARGTAVKSQKLLKELVNE